MLLLVHSVSTSSIFLILSWEENLSLEKAQTDTQTKQTPFKYSALVQRTEKHPAFQNAQSWVTPSEVKVLITATTFKYTR